MSFDLKDYVDVATRIQEFYAKFPEGSIQSEVIELTPERVVIRSFAYRTPDDPRPATGLSQMNIPGTTQFTRGSEVENTETSAVGRAIAMAGFATNGRIASRQEVQNKQQEAPPRPSTPDGTHVMVGTVAKGSGNGMDLALRKTPDGHAIGFKLLELEGHPTSKLSIGVRAFDDFALAIGAQADTLVGQRLTVSGRLRGESFKKDGKDIAYDVLVIETADGPTFVYPPDVAPAPEPAGPTDDDLASLPW